MLLIPTLRRQREADFCVFEANLVYRVNTRTARAVTLKKKGAGEEGLEAGL